MTQITGISITTCKHLGGALLLKVIIADDEIRVVKLIMALGDWDSLDMKVVGTASNGIEAVELIKTLSPDLIITDIRMPGYTGLELIEKAKEINNNLEILIISGYAQFEYAQSAMRFGVSDYLLKPINQVELMNTLSKIKNNYLIKKDTLLQSEKALIREKTDVSKIRTALIQNIIFNGNTYDDMPAEKINAEFHFNFKPALFKAFSIKIDCDILQYNTSAISIVENTIYDIFNAIVKPLCYDFEMLFIGYTGYGICNFEQDKAESLTDAFKECFCNILSKRDMYPDIDVSIFIGNTTNSFQLVSSSFAQAKSMISERIIEGCGRIFENLPVSSAINCSLLIKEFSQTFDSAIEICDSIMASKSYELLKVNALSVKAVCGRELFSLVQNAGERVLSVIPQSDKSKQLHDSFMLSCSMSKNPDELFSCLECLINDVVAWLSDYNEQLDTKPIRLAKQYIKEHYMETITLEQVAEKVGFNSSYFSALFKKKCGMGFVDYLTKTRIDSSKDLLKETNLLITDICERIGYTDIKHFTKTFKKYTSLKPSEYRKLYG